MSITVLIPAHNEQESIANTIESVLSQTRPAERIVVIPNGCTDETATIARQYPVTVEELPRLSHGKSEALNLSWLKYCQNTDIVVCLDADTIIPPHALKDWESEMNSDRNLGGSSSKFTMLGPGLLTRLQKAEFAKWTDSSLRRGSTSVLAGTGCAIRNEALRLVVNADRRDGPWSYESQVEDFELTYRIRQLGWYCQVSPTVRAYTDAMKTIPTLWHQRMKWQVGTVEDLLSIGVNRLTLLDWKQQAAGMFAAMLRVAWISLMFLLALTHSVQFTWYWWVIPPAIFILSDFKSALVIPHRDKFDLLIAATLLPQELFAWMRAAWFLTSWFEVIKVKLIGGRKDRWQLQYQSEGV